MSLRNGTGNNKSREIAKVEHKRILRCVVIAVVVIVIVVVVSHRKSIFCASDKNMKNSVAMPLIGTETCPHARSLSVSVSPFLHYNEQMVLSFCLRRCLFWRFISFGAGCATLIVHSHASSIAHRTEERYICCSQHSASATASVFSFTVFVTIRYRAFAQSTGYPLNWEKLTVLCLCISVFHRFCTQRRWQRQTDRHTRLHTLTRRATHIVLWWKL